MASIKTNKFEMDMCTGSLFRKMLLFTLPLMCSSLLQLLFNAADMVVAGRYAGDTALASISSTGAITNFIINVFVGLSVGANVLVARFYAQQNEKEVSETVHTAVLISILFGLFLAGLGWVVSRPVLTLMKTPEDVIDGSVTYMRIYFLGMPVIMLYNFTSAILRAVGDTKRPLIFLAIAGVINVILNLFFVIVLKIGVAGVAIATVASQAISAGLVLLTLINYDGCLKLEAKKLKLSGSKLGQMARIGLPAGLQGSLFSISNVLIQSSINSFGSAAMSGNAAAANLEGFVYVGMNSFHHTTLSFTSQNYGRRNMERVKKTAIYGLMFVIFFGLVLGLSAWIFRYPLLSLYVKDEGGAIDQIIEYGITRMTVIMFTYFTCGTMDVLVGALRGLGRSILPMIMTLTFVCGFRILWIYTVFAANRSLTTLFLSYPISWLSATIVHGICFIITFKKLQKKAGAAVV
ncbi:MAG: MATE family efflux transporter [Lachnospiraceae bacterium]|nr:MATE family efflux transporter [Lachnospiraceae bacterium]